MDSTESSFLVSEVVNEIRSVFGFDETLAKHMVETGRSNKTTAEEFSLPLKELLPRIPLKYILSIFDTIRENFPLIEINPRLANTLGQKNHQKSESLMLCFKLQFYCLGAIDAKEKLTDLGTKMRKFNVGPFLSRILMAGVDFRCSNEVLTIVAMVSEIGTVGKVFQTPNVEELRAKANQKQVGFYQPDGDHLTLLSIFEAWRKNKDSPSWCVDNFIIFDSLSRADELRGKLFDTMKNRLQLEIVSAGKDHTRIRKAIAAGFFMQSAKWDPEANSYRTMIDPTRSVHIHSGSALCHDRPRFVVYSDLVVGDDKEYMTCVTPIDPKWLVELGQPLFKDPSRAGSQA